MAQDSYSRDVAQAGHGTDYPLKNNPDAMAQAKDYDVICPVCGRELLHLGGCLQCTCGYSKC